MNWPEAQSLITLSSQSKRKRVVEIFGLALCGSCALRVGEGGSLIVDPGYNGGGRSVRVLK